MNELQKIYKEFSYADWDPFLLFTNPNIDINFVIKEINITLEMSSLSQNSSITWEDVLNNPQLRWDYDVMSNNKNITSEIIEANPQIPWSFSELCYNKSINIECLKKFHNSIKTIPFVRANKTISEEYINKNQDVKWDCVYLARNLNLSLNFIEKNIDKDWNFYVLSRHPSITLEFIKKYPNKAWFMREFYSCNPNFDYIDYVVNRDDIKYLNESKQNLFGIISSRKDLSQEIVEKYIHEPWDFYDLLVHPNINFDFILKNLDKVNNEVISFNPNLTLKIIKENPQIKWDFKMISGNKFGKNKILANRKKNKRKEIVNKIISSAKNEDCVFHPTNFPTELIDLILSFI